jgi:hypothetical protein
MLEILKTCSHGKKKIHIVVNHNLDHCFHVLALINKVMKAPTFGQCLNDKIVRWLWAHIVRRK